MTIEKAIDFQEGFVILSEFAHLDGFYEYVITSDGKTDNAARKIPLFTPLRKALEGKSGYIAQNATGDRVNVEDWRILWRSYKTCMETAINGCHKRWYGRTREHKAILEDGGKLPPWIEFTVVPYDLRHSFCVMCRDNGVEMNTCIQWMGHADMKMILKIYDEVSVERSKNQAQKIEKKWEKGQNEGQKKRSKRRKR